MTHGLTPETIRNLEQCCAEMYAEYRWALRKVKQAEDEFWGRNKRMAKAEGMTLPEGRASRPTKRSRPARRSSCAGRTPFALRLAQFLRCWRGRSRTRPVPNACGQLTNSRSHTE